MKIGPNNSAAGIAPFASQSLNPKSIRQELHQEESRQENQGSLSHSARVCVARISNLLTKNHLFGIGYFPTLTRKLATSIIRPKTTDAIVVRMSCLCMRSKAKTTNPESITTPRTSLAAPLTSPPISIPKTRAPKA